MNAPTEKHEQFGLDPITEDWLKSVGFKWHQLDLQPGKHWLLWCGGIGARSFSSHEDIGIEVAVRGEGEWHVWFRSDLSHRYCRFIHIRPMSTQGEIIRLVESVTGLEWNPKNHIYGSVHEQKSADYLRRESDRLDLKFMREGHPWNEIEKDDSMGGALPEHLEAHEKAKIGN